MIPIERWFLARLSLNKGKEAIPPETIGYLVRCGKTFSTNLLTDNSKALMANETRLANSSLLDNFVCEEL